MTAALPRYISHADWGVEPRKRWRAVGELVGGNGYELHVPESVGTTGSITERMGVSPAQGESVLLGFDFPIGLPRNYAQAAGITSFKQALLAFGAEPWERFFDVAEHPEEIGLHRPFYPAGAGIRGQHTRQALMDALDLDASGMLRRCEHAHSHRRAANPLFWTLGGAQVGKGALIGWREMIAPALREAPDKVGLWPFDGPLPTLIGTRRLVVAETYPAEFYTPLDVRFGRRSQNGRWGKRQQQNRRAQAQALLHPAATVGASVTESLAAEIIDGFGSRSDGEDRFDAVVGLLGMLHIVLGKLPEGAPPNDDAVLSVEGWILGRPS
jgi:hypothetical protein